MKLYLTPALLLLSICALQQQGVDAQNGLPKAVVKLMDEFFMSFLPKLIGTRPYNENGTFAQYAKFANQDQSNEDAATLSLQELIVRSGYKFENHYVVSDDGYVTQLCRLINPLADPKKLKQPPVAMFHGGIINPTAYVISSSIQHHPERYPQLPGDFHTSSNRSIAYVLANNGYDVWLIGTRGANRANQGHLKHKVFQLKGFLSKDEWIEKTRNAIEGSKEVYQLFKYWDYTMDDIGEYEIPVQVDKILEITGAKKVTLYTFSLSTMTCLPVLATNKNFSAKVHNLIVMAPIVNAKGVNLILRTIFEVVIRLEYNLGTVITSVILTSQMIRDIVLCIGSNRDLRYTLIKGLFGLLSGSSAKYFTLLEGPIMGHAFEPLGFKEAQHYMQQALAGRLQKYDHGFVKNELEYGTARPPKYDLRRIDVKNWMLVSSENDNLATPGSVRQVLNEMSHWPQTHAFYPGANHADLFAGMEVDRFVVLPILRFLNRFALPPLEVHPPKLTKEKIAEQKELIELVPADTTTMRVAARTLISQ